MLFLQNPIPVDREGARNRGHCKHFCHRSVETAVSILRPSHFVLADNFLPFLLVGIQTHTENY